MSLYINCYIDIDYIQIINILIKKNLLLWRGLSAQRNTHLIPPRAGGTQEPGLRLVTARRVMN